MKCLITQFSPPFYHFIYPWSKYSPQHPVLDRLCDLVVRIPDCSPRGPRFDFWCYQISLVVVGLERGPLSLMRIFEELLERKGTGLQNRD
jgi:hypothetical protein